jgi:hypothetical protein
VAAAAPTVAVVVQGVLAVTAVHLAAAVVAVVPDLPQQALVVPVAQAKFG